MTALHLTAHVVALTQAVLLFLRFIRAHQSYNLTTTAFLLAACHSSNAAGSEGTSVHCTLGPGNWTLDSTAPAVALTNYVTTITGAEALPQRVGARDTKEYSTQLHLPAQLSAPFLIIPPNATLTISNLQLTGSLWRPPSEPEIPKPVAISISQSALLRLVNVRILVTCKSIYLYQTFVCQRQILPSPDFNVDYGTLTYLSYISPLLELVNVSMTCVSTSSQTAAPQPPPPCISVVATTGADVLTAITNPWRAGSDSQILIFIYIARNFSLLPAAAATTTVTTAIATSPPPPPPSSRPSFLLSQNWLTISGSPDGTTWLDLSQSESLILLEGNARVVLQDLTLVGLPVGPAVEYPLALLRVPIWTFNFRRLYLSKFTNRLALRNIRLSLTPVEVAAVAQDVTATLTSPPPGEIYPVGPSCISNLGLFATSTLEALLMHQVAPPPDSANSASASISHRESMTTNATTNCNVRTRMGTTPAVAAAAASAATPPRLPGDPRVSFLLRKAISIYSSLMIFDNVTLEPSAPESDLFGNVDWRREPICQLLPLQPRSKAPRKPIDLRSEVLQIRDELIRPALITTQSFKRPCYVLLQDAGLLTGTPDDGRTKSFSQIQSYIEGESVLLGDPVRQRILDTYQQAAAVNLRSPGASLTLRGMVLTNLSAARLHPLSMASTANGNATTTTASFRRRNRRLMSSESYITASTAERRSCRGGGGGDGTARFLPRTCLQEQSFSSSPSPSPVADIRAAAGTDPTGGLPSGLRNFTSCLWVLDFDRNSSRDGGDVNGSTARLDSVVLVIPRREVVLIASLWSLNDTAAVTDADVAPQLRDMFDRSVLAGCSGVVSNRFVDGSRDHDYEHEHDGGSDGDEGAVSLTFDSLHWCGFEGRNVTLASMWPLKAPTGANTWKSTTELELPVLRQNGIVDAPAPAAMGPRLPPPAPPLQALNDGISYLANKLGKNGNPRALIVSVACGVGAGLLVALLVCIVLCCVVRRRRRRQRRRQRLTVIDENAADLTVASPSPAGHRCVPYEDSTPSLSVPGLRAAAVALASGPAASQQLTAAPPGRQASDSVNQRSGSSPKVTAAAAASPVPDDINDGGGCSQALGTVYDSTISDLANYLGPGTNSPSPLGAVLSGGKGGNGGLAGDNTAATGAEAGKPTAATAAEDSGADRLPEQSLAIVTLPACNISTSTPLMPCAVQSVAPPIVQTSPTNSTDDRKSLTEAAAAAPASQDSELHQQQQQQQQQALLRQIAFSLHARMLQTRDAVSETPSIPSAFGGESSQPATGPHRPTGQRGSAAHMAWDNQSPVHEDLVGTTADKAGHANTVSQSRAGAVASGGSVVAEARALTVTGVLGRGAQGVVYRGRWRGIDVAVKSLLLYRTPMSLPTDHSSSIAAAICPSATSLESVTALELAQRHALREAAISVAASKHPNVVATYHVDICALGPDEPAAVTSWKITLISQFCDGGNLRNALASGMLVRCAASGAAGSGGAATVLDASIAGVVAAPRSSEVSGTSAPSIAAAAPYSRHQASLSVNSTTAAAAAAAAALPQLQVQKSLEQKPQSQLLQPRVLLLLALDVALGLAQLHSMNIVHGDVSSSNVLLVSLAGGASGASGGHCQGGGGSGSGGSSGDGGVATAVAATISSSIAITMSTISEKPSQQPKPGVIDNDDIGPLCQLTSTTMSTGAWFSNSSDALELLAELPYERARTARHVRIEGGGGGGGGIDTAAAMVLGRYGYVAKLCDFGFAEVLTRGQPHVLTPCRRSSAYTAPELALMGRLGPASDVYSWGVLCWEMALGMPLPVALASPAGTAVRVWLTAADTASSALQQQQLGKGSNGSAGRGGDCSAAALAAATPGGALPPALLTWPPYVPHALVVLVGECLRADPETRPTAQDVVQRLEHIITSL